VTDFAEIPRLAEAMLETMYDAHGVGLAAPQIGLGLRLFVAVDYEDDEPEGEDAAPRRRAASELVVVNPTLEPVGGVEVSGVEGCLSIPGIYEDDVWRAQAVRVRYQDERGEPRILEAEDHLARVLQHEFDHLNGRLFLDLLEPEALAAHRADLAEMQRKAKAFLKDNPKELKLGGPGKNG